MARAKGSRGPSGGAKLSTDLARAKSVDNSLRAAIDLRRAGRLASARRLLSRLARRNPACAETRYQLAWVCDASGDERNAAPHYERALELGLAKGAREGALLSLGSTYRVLGRHAEAVKALRRGAQEFPKSRAIRVFLALALQSSGKERAALKLLLGELLETTRDRGIRAYGPALSRYQAKL